MSLLLTVSRMVATALAGLYAGGVLFVVIAPSVARMPGAAYVTYWQALNADYGRAMPPFLLAGIGVTLVASALSWQRGWPAFGACTAALILLVATVALTVAGMEPLNRIANGWDPAQPPAGWHEIRQRWLGLHLLRAVLALAAFACLIAAQGLDHDRPAPLNRTDLPLESNVP
ncbi:DUF1772 domain-containing protein [Nonomuraea sp. PA05]|uniref:DUF1772 domain-containing protein n=1 Tax=Nonomuraea sp. PA05 TaxID=2604466 RepID=UPI0021CC9BC1|nr:DUF1772 domain-containing protein [Nonomuraea sp. PA05]